MSIYKKINEARVKFHSLELKKSGHNKFAGYHYFELGDFIIPAIQIFSEVGLCAIVTFGSDEAMMRIYDTDSKDVIVITSPMGSAALKGCHEVQNIGAVETYQRRYLWVAALEIVEHDALDATNGKDAPSKQIELAGDDQLAEIWALIEETDTDAKKFCQYLKIDKLDSLPADRFEFAKAALLKKVK